ARAGGVLLRRDGGRDLGGGVVDARDVLGESREPTFERRDLLALLLAVALRPLQIGAQAGDLLAVRRRLGRAGGERESGGDEQRGRRETPKHDHVSLSHFSRLSPEFAGAGGAGGYERR